jgi:tetratricopeptide (TPR) repeat protein
MESATEVVRAGEAQPQRPSRSAPKRAAPPAGFQAPGASPISTEYFFHSFLLLLGRLGNSILSLYNRLFVLDGRDERQIYENLARGFRKKGLPEKALVAYRELVRLMPTNAEAHFQIGRLYASKGDLELAARCYHNAIKHKPTHAEAFFYLSGLHSKNNETTQAIEALAKAVELAPENHRWLYKLGVLEDKCGSPEKAAQYLQRAIKLCRNEPKYHQYLGFIFEGLGRHEEAIRHFKIVTELEEAQEGEDL